MNKYEQIMESGCMEDYKHSLTTEGDMTYCEPDWYKTEAEIETDRVNAAIELLRANGYTVIMPVEW